MCQQPPVHAFTYDRNFSSLQALWVSQWALTVFTLVALLGHFQLASAADVSLEWDPVADERVAVYKVHWGTASGEYQSAQEAVSTTTTITGLQEGATYYFAACACDENAALCSEFSEEISTTIAYASPQADFSASTSSGVAPLLVDWTNESTGTVESYHWDFGDGQTSSAASPTYIYMQPGTYAVTLTVSGPGGSDSKTYSESVEVTGESPYFTQQPFPVDDPTDGGESDDVPGELSIEVGELDVDSAWQWVDLQQSFNDPVVIAKVVSAYDVDPVVVIIDDVDSSGFSIRLREWDYQDDFHAIETVYYVVVERGRHQLPDGAWIDADRVDIAKINRFGSTTFSEPFIMAPVVLTTVSAYAGLNAVTTRVRKVGLDGFEAKLQTQEVDKKLRTRVAGTIAYIAWEPSSVELNGFQVEVDRMVEGVNHAPTTIDYAVPSELPPILLADMQTTNGGDTASLRVADNDVASVDVWVQEDQSKDRETRHVPEEVGYLVIVDGATALAQ